MAILPIGMMRRRGQPYNQAMGGGQDTSTPSPSATATRRYTGFNPNMPDMSGGFRGIAPGTVTQPLMNKFPSQQSIPLNPNVAQAGGYGGSNVGPVQNLQAGAINPMLVQMRRKGILPAY